MNIIKEMTKGCPREDCQIASDRSGVANSAGSSCRWSCDSCGREWSVHHPAQWERTTYDKNGKASVPKAVPPTVREIHRKAVL